MGTSIDGTAWAAAKSIKPVTLAKAGLRIHPKTAFPPKREWPWRGAEELCKGLLTDPHRTGPNPRNNGDRLGQDIFNIPQDLLTRCVRLSVVAVDRIRSAAPDKASIPFPCADAFDATLGLETTAPVATGQL